jgi:Uma2 family endonuclease
MCSTPLLASLECQGAYTTKQEASTFVYGLVNKKRIYARMGVKELWIIDPEPKEVVVYRFDQDPIEPVVKLSGQEEISSPLLPGLAIRLSEIFRPG